MPRMRELAFDQTEKEYNGNKYQQRDIKFFEEAEGIEYSEENKDLLPQSKLTEEKKEVDWEEVSRGKVRHGVAVAYIGLKKELNEETEEEMNTWVNWIMKGSNNEEIKLDNLHF